MDNSWLKKRREQIGLSQKAFADRLAERGIKRETNSISHWESGNTIPLLGSKEESRILADVLQWTLEELLAVVYGVSFYRVDVPEIVHSMGGGAYRVIVPTVLSYEILISLRKHIKSLADKENVQKIAVLYVYPKEPIYMPDFKEEEETTLATLVNPTRTIHYDYVVYLNIAYNEGVIPGAVRMMYRFIHLVLPIFGKRCDFAETPEQATKFIEDWKEANKTT